MVLASFKGSNSKDGSEQRIVSFKAERTVFDLHLAASYLSSGTVSYDLQITYI